MNTTIVPKSGDLLTSSWGWNQTNVSAYKVVGVTPKCVKLIKIGIKRVTEDSAIPDETNVRAGVASQVFTKKVKPTAKGYCVAMSNYEFAYLWDGKPEYITPYGCGH